MLSSLFLPKLCDDIIQNVSVAHCVELSCRVVHESAGIRAVKDADGTWQVYMQGVCQHFDYPSNLSMKSEI